VAAPRPPSPPSPSQLSTTPSSSWRRYVVRNPPSTPPVPCVAPSAYWPLLIATDLALRSPYRWIVLAQGLCLRALLLERSGKAAEAATAFADLWRQVLAPSFPLMARPSPGDAPAEVRALDPVRIDLLCNRKAVAGNPKTYLY
jgi:hypothetical protein